MSSRLLMTEVYFVMCRVCYGEYVSLLASMGFASVANFMERMEAGESDYRHWRRIVIIRWFKRGRLTREGRAF